MRSKFQSLGSKRSALPLLEQLHNVNEMTTNLQFSHIKHAVHPHRHYLSRHIRPRESARHLRSSTAPLLYKPVTRTRFADRAFRCTAPTVWNSLATDITTSCSLTLFKSK